MKLIWGMLASIYSGKKSAATPTARFADRHDSGRQTKLGIDAISATSSTGLWRREASECRLLQQIQFRQISLRLVLKFANYCKTVDHYGSHKAIVLILMLLQKSSAYIPPPSPLEPPIDPRTSGPRQFLEYRQKATTVVGSGSTRR
jgi:hypothetical protein